MVPSGRATRVVPVPVPAAAGAAAAGVVVPRLTPGAPPRRWRSWISSPQRRLTRLSTLWTNEPLRHSTTSPSIFNIDFPRTVRRIMARVAAVVPEVEAEETSASSGVVLGSSSSEVAGVSSDLVAASSVESAESSEAVVVTQLALAAASAAAVAVAAGAALASASAAASLSVAVAAKVVSSSSPGAHTLVLTEVPTGVPTGVPMGVSTAAEAGLPGVEAVAATLAAAAASAEQEAESSLFKATQSILIAVILVATYHVDVHHPVALTT